MMVARRTHYKGHAGSESMLLPTNCSGHLHWSARAGKALGQVCALDVLSASNGSLESRSNLGLCSSLGPAIGTVKRSQSAVTTEY